MASIVGYTVDGCRQEVLDVWREMYPCDRAIGIVENQGYIATGTAVEAEVVLPGGSVSRGACIACMAVAPTATRKGLLRAMMKHLHRRAADEGHALTCLAASDWRIYGRFGYGPASWYNSIALDTRLAKMDDDNMFGASPPGDELRCLGPDEAQEIARTLSRVHSRSIPGAIIPAPSYWKRFELDEHASGHARQLSRLMDSTCGVGPRRFVALADRGLASYRIEARGTDEGLANYTLWVTDLMATDVGTVRELWRHILGVDLVTNVRVSKLAVDDPLYWWISNAREIRRVIRDGLWVRPLDVRTLLESRTWVGSGSLRLRIHDSEGYANGTFRLCVEEGKGSTVRTDGDPDLEMDAAGFGAIILGGTSACSLARSGRIRAASSRAALLWDALATPARAPFTSTVF